MDLKLVRTTEGPDGIFSELRDAKFNKVLWLTLEHSFYGKPKIPDGIFTCVRGQHRLHGMTEDFTTFEVTGVEGHSGLLIHTGNWNSDSDGCILLGEGSASSSKGPMVTASKQAFAEFMQRQAGVDSFTLTVQS